VGYYFLLKTNNAVTSASDWYGNLFIAVVIIITFTAGTAFIFWLGERINDHGIGNGISIILFTGIISRTPDAINLLYAAIASLTKPSLDRRLSKAVYEIRSVADQGECPPLDELFKSPSETLSANTLTAYNYILTSGADKLFKFTVGDDTTEQIEMIAEKIIAYAIDKRLKSKEMLTQKDQDNI